MQKTEYEMRISDWSSDVCSSDLGHGLRDVCYFMVAALTVDERRQADRRLLDHYREALLATGAEGVPDRETMWDHFRRWPVYGIQAWLQVEEWWGQNGRP